MFRNGRTVLIGALLVSFGALAFPQDLFFGTKQARSDATWVNHSTIYEIWLNAFSAEGTLHGATANLKRVADLGASVVYLGPIAKGSQKPYASPYNIADYNAIDPRYGTEADLHEFVSAAHAFHLKVMLDVVYYHTAPDGAMAQHDAWLQRTTDGKVARGFWPQPLPDYHNPQVRKYLIDSLLHWVRDFKVDGFRCDVGGGVPVSFWEEARVALDAVNSEVLLLSESDRPDDQLHAFDISYDFAGYLTLRSVIRDGEPASKIRQHWEEAHHTYPQGARLLHFSDNHDWRRAVLQFGDNGAFAASVLNFTLDGIPFLYNGQEIGDGTPTHWISGAPITWPGHVDRNDRETVNETLERYKQLFAMRQQSKALTTGSVEWVNNTEPDRVLSFLRSCATERVLVLVNLSNRDTHVTVDLPVMEYSSVDNLLTRKKTYFPLYSGRVSAELKAYESIVGRQIPLQPLVEPKP